MFSVYNDYSFWTSQLLIATLCVKLVMNSKEDEFIRELNDTELFSESLGPGVFLYGELGKRWQFFFLVLADLLV